MTDISKLSEQAARTDIVEDNRPVADYTTESLKRRRHKSEPEEKDHILPADPKTLPKVQLTKHQEALMDHVIAVAFMAPEHQPR